MKKNDVIYIATEQIQMKCKVDKDVPPTIEAICTLANPVSFHSDCIWLSEWTWHLSLFTTMRTLRLRQIQDKSKMAAWLIPRIDMQISVSARRYMEMKMIFWENEEDLSFSMCQTPCKLNKLGLSTRSLSEKKCFLDMTNLFGHWFIWKCWGLLPPTHIVHFQGHFTCVTTDIINPHLA